MVSVQFTDAAQVRALSCASAKLDPWASYLAAILTDGPRAYADNANAEMEALTVGDMVLPLLINRGGRECAAVCSPYSHYVSYTLEEFGKRHPRLPPWLIATAFGPGAHFLHAAGIDCVVTFNNWLITTNPSACLDASQICEITAILLGRYPDCAVIMRSLNPRIDGALLEALRRNGYHTVRSRRIYMVDTGSRDHLQFENARRDLRSLERTPYEVVSDPKALAPHAERIADLYRNLYLGKHSRLNMAFNARFFALTFSTGVLEYRAFMRNGRIDAFIAFFVKDRLMTCCMLGYDLTLPRSFGLYRIAFASAFAEAASRGLPMNLSAGSGAFKAHRGGEPLDEFDAVYCRHLALARRTAWFVLGGASRVPAAVGAERRARPRPDGYDWNSLARVWGASGPQALWRRHSDAVNLDLIERWMLQRPAGLLLKTDAFDEAFGSGLLANLAGRARGVITIDISNEVLSAAVARGTAGARVQADVRRLPFLDSSIDVVLSTSTLDHFDSVEEIALAVGELARVLRPGGTIILTMDNRANPAVWLRNALPMRWLLRTGLVPYQVGVTAGVRQLRRMLARRGFTEIETETVLHCPRVLAVPLAGFLDRHGGARAKSIFCRGLMAMECLRSLPTRFRTGHFVALRAVKK